MSRGFEQTGRFEVVLGIDHDPAASGTFKSNHPAAGYIKGNICFIRGLPGSKEQLPGREQLTIINHLSNQALGDITKERPQHPL